MAAAYAAVVSLMQIIEQIQNHPDPPISLDDEFLQSLTENLTFLQDFLETHSHVGCSDGLQRRIADAAYAAEDVIESHIVNRVFAGCNSALVSSMRTLEQIQSHTYTPDKEQVECLTANISFLRDFLQIHAHVGSDASESRIADASGEIESVGEIYSDEEISSIEFYQDLQRVILDMDLIKDDIMEIKENLGVQSQLHRSSSASFRSPSILQSKSMVGFDDVLVETMDKLTGGQAARQIIPISGMAGLGKTTLARNIYVNPLIQQHFDICAWATISQEYSTREILRGILCLEGKESREYSSEESEYELGEKLYKRLSGRRYLIVMDDMWSIEAWDGIKFFFPDYNNGSRIVITTRLSNLALQLSDSYGVEMKLLDEDQSWNLFKSVLENEDCPLELEEIGRKIAKGCQGLPLSIVVIGGLLAKSKDVQEYWEYIAENLNSVVNLEDNERCLKILHMSYNQLPVYLKPCFLYMGVFPEDDEIRASELIKLWVAEGFLKPIDGKSLEKVAEEYLRELIDRNLVSVHKLGSNGKTKLCKIHDLLRDLCLREAQKEKFFFVANVVHGINAERRICIHHSADIPQAIRAMETASVARSFISNGFRGFSLRSFRLLRVSSIVDDSFPVIDKPFSPEDISQQVNLRYIAVNIRFHDQFFRFPSSTYFFWNLQTFIVKEFSLSYKIVRFEIWRMPLLRHIKFDTLEIPSPPTDEPGAVVLENLQSLSCIHNFCFDNEAVRRIPSIKKLEISYDHFKEEYRLNNLDRLHKLESLNLSFQPGYRAKGHLKHNITFPESLKKLTLLGTSFHWEDMATTIGSLPFLEVLKLKCRAFVGTEWETVEGQFCSLKYLLVSEVFSLKCWKTENTHFPRLECLLLKDLHVLEEIPLSVGDIGTLELVYLEGCGSSVVASAKRILEEQEELGNFDLKVVVHSD